jgi:hypothetical protein
MVKTAFATNCTSKRTCLSMHLALVIASQVQYEYFCTGIYKQTITSNKLSHSATTFVLDNFLLKTGDSSIDFSFV